MKQIRTISILALVVMTAAGCHDFYTDLSDQPLIPVMPQLSPSLTASRVYGQLGNFTTGYTNTPLGIASADNLLYPADVAAGETGVYIADYTNNRVLYYPGAKTTASRVYGQGGSFVLNLPNTPSLSADSLSSPAGVAVAANGVYIADAGNNRVLFYAGTSTTATRVYGQDNGFTTNGGNHGGLGAGSLNNPVGVAVDASGVYIADADNNRVLFYSEAETTASRVYGQGGNFDTNDENYGGLGAGSLNHPISIALDRDGVYIADKGNNRVLYFPGASTTASRVYGQFGNFVTTTANNGGVSADSLSSPSGIEVNAGGLYISDNQNNRVLYFSGASTTASRVYGQAGSFTTNYINNGTPLDPSATSLSGPMGLAVDGSRLYIVDSGNNRVLRY